MDELADTGDENPETTAAYRKAIRERFATLERDKTRLQKQLAGQEATQWPAADTDAALLDFLPELGRGLGSLTAEAQRELYDAFQLEVRYNRERGEALLRVTINADTAETLAGRTKHLAHGSEEARAATEAYRADTVREAAGPAASHVLGAPGRTRTCGQVLRRHLLYPLSYGGRAGAAGALRTRCLRFRPSGPWYWRARWFRDLAGVKDRALRTSYRLLHLRDTMWRFGEAV
ncbi:protein of unknown function [Streptantibioticus cattleyicolor NRRL 8057 = DSM 46488]|nr:protein of unknown function [Streptantibioticus cattleyicolor NRRL 8057 = DSM 46488]